MRDIGLCERSHAAHLTPRSRVHAGGGHALPRRSVTGICSHAHLNYFDIRNEFNCTAQRLEHAGYCVTILTDFDRVVNTHSVEGPYRGQIGSDLK